MRSRRAAALLFGLSLSCAVAAAAPPPAPEPLPKIAAKTAGLERRAGLLVTWLDRQRGRVWLEKVDPAAAHSPVKQPIVFYVDPGAPEPVRSALVAGASWWQEAFAAAGFDDAYRVELLPPGAHPLDARYNVIQWVHRATRGWSYGGGVVDPRTGELLKGHVTLGSQRVQQEETAAGPKPSPPPPGAPIGGALPARLAGCSWDE